MSDPGPFGDAAGDDPFKGMPFLGDLARMLGAQGPIAWDAARQMAMSIAVADGAETNVDPVERVALEQLARAAELRVADQTGLKTSVAGRQLSVVPVNRSGWVQTSLDAYKDRFETLATSLRGPDQPEVDPGDPNDPGAAWLGGLMQMLGPMMLAMTAGSLLGHLAQRSLGQYDLPIPRPPSDDLLVVLPAVDAFADEWSLSRDDVRLWVCVHEIAHHAVLAVPHVRTRLDDLLDQYLGGFEQNPTALEDKIDELDPSQMTGLEGLQGLLGDPEALLGAIQSPAQRDLLPHLHALVAAIVGYVDWVMDEVGGALISDYGRLTEAARRRRVEAGPADRFVERLFGLELVQSEYDRGSAFIEGIVDRAGTDGLARLWASEKELPTPAEVDAPGLWLARIDL